MGIILNTIWGMYRCEPVVVTYHGIFMSDTNAKGTCYVGTLLINSLYERDNVMTSSLLLSVLGTAT